MEQLVKYNVTDAAISKMKNEYMKLTVQGLNDEAGLSQVHAARMVVKNHRVDVEKTRKELKADALEWGRKVDAEAKRITAMLEPIEAHLTAEEEKVTKEKERIRQEKIRKEEERVAKIREKIESIKNLGIVEYPETSEQLITRIDKLPPIDKTFMEFTQEAEKVRAETYDKLNTLLDKRLVYEAEQAAQKAEAERLEKLRKEQAEAQAKIDAENARIAEENRKLQEEKDRIEREKRADQERKDREEFERKAKEDARIQAEKDAKEKAERAEVERKEREAREAKEAEERTQREAAEKARQAALRPDKDKLIDWANSCIDFCQVSEKLESQELRDIQNAASLVILGTLRDLIKQVEAL